MSFGPTIRSKQVRDAARQAVAQKVITQEDADAVWWLYCHARDNQLSNGTIGKLIGYDSTTVSRVYNLTYNGGKVGPIAEKIRDLQRDLELEAERSKYGDTGFIETSLSKAIFETCDAARFSQTMATIWGESQTGKSEALKRYTALNNHGRTRYLEVCEAMSPFGFLRALAETCQTNTSGNNWAVWKNLVENLTPNTLLIIDEVHQPFSTGKYNTGAKIIETARGIFNKVGCGVVLCGTNALRDELNIGRLKNVFTQTRKRGVIRVQCPDVLPLRDIWKFTAAHGLQQPKPKTAEHELVNRIRKTNGISELTKYLKAGAALAANQKQPYAWKHFIESHDIHQKYASEGWWN